MAVFRISIVTTDLARKEGSTFVRHEASKLSGNEAFIFVNHYFPGDQIAFEVLNSTKPEEVRHK